MDVPFWGFITTCTEMDSGFEPYWGEVSSNDFRMECGRMRYHHFDTFLMDVTRNMDDRLHTNRSHSILRQWFLVSHIVRVIIL